MQETAAEPQDWPDWAYELPSDAASSTDGHQPGDAFNVLEDMTTIEALEFLAPTAGWSPSDDDAYVCEDEDTFESLVNDDFFVVRKTTNRKDKKLSTMMNLLDSQDLTQTR